jgi:ABC-type Fe3+/spermidine/putrescine transport system ATPase subunit
VALARALVYEPRVLLLDEPLAALDKKLREEMRAELRDIQRSVGITTVFVTHDQAEALGLSDRIAVMHAGRIEQLGAPREIYERPASRFVAEFIGASTVVRGRATGADRLALPGGAVLRVEAGPAFRPGEEIELAIRPERIRLVAGAGENVVDGRVSSVVYQGVQTEVSVEVAGGPRLLVFVAEPASTALAPGQALRLHLPPGAFMRLV